MRTTDIDFTTSTYHNSGGEICPLTNWVRADNCAYIAGLVSATGRVAALQKWLLPAQGWFIGCATFHSDADRPLGDWYIDLVTIDTTTDR